jgi:flagellar motor protein MotB
MFILSVALTGCGNLKKKEFNEVFDSYKTEHTGYHDTTHYKKTDVDGKLTAQQDALSSDITKAKDEAIAKAEQGDADTMEGAKEYAQSEASKVRADAQKAASAAEAKSKEYARAEDEKVRQELNRAMSATATRANSASTMANSVMAKLQDIDKAQKDLAESRGKKIATVQFASNRVALSKDAKAELDKAAEAINKYQGALIVVKGHADGRVVLGGKYRSNWDLSEARAKSVISYLKEKGVTNEMKAEARAHTEPIANAFTKAGQAMNRRAEVIIYPGGTEM